MAVNWHWQSLRNAPFLGKQFARAMLISLAWKDPRRNSPDSPAGASRAGIRDFLAGSSRTGIWKILSRMSPGGTDMPGDDPLAAIPQHLFAARKVCRSTGASFYTARVLEHASQRVMIRLLLPLGQFHKLD
jgi:hypothetical protein